jgi:hypothetical protein
MRALLERARQRVRNDSEGGESNEDITELARIAMVEGQTETALRELERAYAAGARYINTFLQDDPIFQPVRDHPRFRSLVQRTEADLARMRERVRNTSK